MSTPEEIVDRPDEQNRDPTLEEEDLTPEEEADPEQEFRDKQLLEAREQNLKGDNAVPEQRPQAFLELPDSMKSQTQLQRESDGSQEPMPKEAFDRAADPKQHRKAEKKERAPRLLHGETVRIVDHDNEAMIGRKGVITDIQFTPEGGRDARSGVPDLHNFAEVEEYTVTTRDEGNHVVPCTPDQVERINPTSLSGRDTFTG